MSAEVPTAAAESSRWQWLVRLLFRRIWFRAAMFSASAVALALLAAVVTPFIPYDISGKIGADAVDNILGILASSMLAVTTFSLTAMVSAFSGANSTITPRATQLLVEDSTAQNALSTFLGAFLFAIVGICALSTGIYGTSGRVILFVGTILVIAIIVVTLLRWIEHLSSFGRVGSTIDRVEKVTAEAIQRTGYVVLTSVSETPDPSSERSIFPDEIGYVTHIDVTALENIAGRLECAIDVQVLPGAFVTPAREIARMERGDPAVESEIRAAFTFDHHRQYDHDPRLGLVVLSEIASRALSPGVNDPGTAIAVLGSGTRAMVAFLKEIETKSGDEAKRVRLPALVIDDLLEDMFRPIARDGANSVEVAIRLQRSLGEIGGLAPRAHGALVRTGAEALARCEAAMTFEADLERVRAAYRGWATIQASPKGASRG